VVQVSAGESKLTVGGVLGVYCSHDYAHASGTIERRLPGMLKGQDAALWSICETLGLPQVALPVYSPEEEDECSDDDSEHWYDDEYEEPSRWDPVTLFHWDAGSRAHLNKESGFDWIGSCFEPVQHDWMGDDSESLGKRLPEAGSFSKYRGIHWINRSSHSELNVAYTTVIHG
jgi:hypothetical protein